MWYFSWVLGVCLAGGVGILNAMWFEMHHKGDLVKKKESHLASADE
jgi:cyd operon protein YbgT